jgi:hypothetical protein
MNLRETLEVILKSFLPPDPNEAVKGTELIRTIKAKLPEEYSDATLRYHFSIMCRDPASPIAKVEKGQGYYLRTTSLATPTPGTFTPYQAKMGLLFDQTGGQMDQVMERQKKLRVVFSRYTEQQGAYPFLFENSFGSGASFENIWKCPDAVAVHWAAGVPHETHLALDRQKLEFYRSMNIPAFSITSVKLKQQLSHATMREDVFQAISNARWANCGELVIAEPILDGYLADDLRELATEFGLGISSLGLGVEQLDELPPHWELLRMEGRALEALLDKITVQRICSARSRSLASSALERMEQENEDMRDLLDWVRSSLSSASVQSYSLYDKARDRQRMAAIEDPNFALRS